MNINNITRKLLGIKVEWLFPRAYIYHLKRHFGNEPLVCAEVGVLYGNNAKSILSELNVEKMYLIDEYKPYRENYDNGTKEQDELEYAEKKAMTKLARWWCKLVWLEIDSHLASKKIKEKLDFVYIDGNHDYEYVKRDIEDYWKLIKKGGILCGHDMNIFSVARAVVEFATNKNLKVITDTRGVDWLIKK